MRKLNALLILVVAGLTVWGVIMSVRMYRDTQARELRQENLRQALIIGAEADKHCPPYVSTENPHSTETRYIVFSIYGSDPRYIIGAQRNVELAPIIYPGWKVRFYTVRSQISPEVVQMLQEKGAEVVFLAETHPLVHMPMCWRFLVADDPQVDRFIIRDSDSRLSMREKSAVDEWIASGKVAHSMRDHFYHNEYVINGGLWGAKRGFLKTGAAGGKSMEALMVEFFVTAKYEYFADMDFLQDIIWPMFGGDVEQHDSINCKKPGNRPFSVARGANLHVVGGVHLGLDDQPLAENLGFYYPFECMPACVFKGNNLFDLIKKK